MSGTQHEQKKFTPFIHSKSDETHRSTIYDKPVKADDKEFVGLNSEDINEQKSKTSS